MYDLKPEWYEWYINDKPLGTKPLKYFLETDGKIDSVIVKTQDLPTDVGGIREESEAYLDKIIATCGFNKFGVLTSGIDSEIIVRYLAKKKLDVEMYYIKFWMKDDTEVNILKEISRETGAKLNIIEWDWKKHKKGMLTLVSDCLSPTTVISTYLHALENIPTDRFLLGGRRTLTEGVATSRNLTYIRKPDDKARTHYFDVRELKGRYACNLLKRHSCLTFWFNDSRTASSVLRDKRTIIFKEGGIYTKDMFLEDWKECTFRKSTHPFVGPNSLYKWEEWNQDHWRPKAASVANMQRRYLRMKYGVVPSVCDTKKRDTNLWHFGSAVNIDKLLGVESKEDPPSWDSIMSRPAS